MPYVKVYVVRRHRFPIKEIYFLYYKTDNFVTFFLFNLFCVYFTTSVLITDSDIILAKNLHLNFLSHLFAWRQTAQSSMFLQFSVSRGPRVLIPCTVVNIRFFLTVFKEGFENIFFHLPDICHKKKHVVFCMSRFCTLSGSGQEVTRYKAMSLYILRPCLL
jgi:hypothetical protein